MRMRISWPCQIPLTTLPVLTTGSTLELSHGPGREEAVSNGLGDHIRETVELEVVDKCATEGLMKAMQRAAVGLVGVEFARKFAGTAVTEMCRKMGVAEATFYHWKKRYRGLGVSEIRRCLPVRRRLSPRRTTLQPTERQTMTGQTRCPGILLNMAYRKLVAGIPSS